MYNEDKNREIRSVFRRSVHEIVNAFSRLNTAVELFRDNPDRFNTQFLEGERAAAYAKFEQAMDALPKLE
jgi:hypothetical protein